MPLIHRQFPPELKNPDGQLLAVSPSEAMVRFGARVAVSIGLAQQFAEQLTLRGEQVPEPLVGEALIDSGASHTCVDTSIAGRLALPVVGQVNISSASHESTQLNQYPIRLEFIGAGIAANVLQAPSGPLGSQGLAVLIGRDLLREFLLVYNGPYGQWTLAPG